MKIETKKADVIWSYLGYILSLAINVILLPWILKSVEQAELGVWYTFASVSTIVNTVDFGFSPTIIRNLTYAWSGARVLKKTGVQYVDKDTTPNYKLYGEVLLASRFLYLAISSIALLILLTIGSVYIKHISVGLVKKAMLAWVIYAFGCFMNLYYSYWPLVLRSIGKMAESQKATVLSKVVQFLVSMIGLKLGGGIIALAIAYVLSGIVLRGCAKIYFMRQEEIRRNIDIKNRGIEKKQVFEILAILWYNAKKAGVSTVSTTIMGQAGTIVCSGALGVNATAEYGLVMQLMNVLTGVGQIIYQIHVPVLTNAKVLNDIKCQQRKYSLSVVGFFLVSIFGTVFCVTLLDDIVALLGSNTVFNSMLFLGVALYYIPEKNYAISAGYVAIGNELPFVKSLVLTSVARIFLLLINIYIFKLGLWGIVLAGVISNYSYIVWKWPSVAMNQLDLTIIDLVKIGCKELYNICMSQVKKTM